MTSIRLGAALCVLAAMFVAAGFGCTMVVTTAAQKAWEDRSTEDQITDTKIAAGILKRLAAEDKGLLLDVKVDAWEKRVMLTGTLDSRPAHERVLRLVREDERITALYDHIQIVSTAQRDERRGQEQKADEGKGGVGQMVSDVWIKAKIKVKLLASRGVTSVNYRWRSVLNKVYIIGRAGDAEERDKVLRIARETKGVKSVVHHIQVIPKKG